MTTYYTKQHEWIRVEGDTATIGITAYAARQLGEVVYVELPEEGARLEREKEFGVVESSKTASDVYAPVSGTVLAANTAITEETERVNEDPEGEAWFVRIEISDAGELSGLMDKAAYDAFCEGL
jgi:glycine cleavage system H protein